MKNVLSRIYIIMFAISMLLALYVLCVFRPDVSKREKTDGFEEVTDYSYKIYENVSAPLGIREEYIFRFDEAKEAYRDLMFYTIHQNVDVYVVRNRIYRMRPYVNNDFGNTPGRMWNQVSLEDDEMGKYIRVVIYPVYKSSIGVVPTFYFGEGQDIVMSVLYNQMPELLIGLVCLLVGVIFSFYSIYNYKNTDRDISLAMLGCFAVVLSLWKITDNEAVYLLFPNLQGMYFLPLLLLHLISIPFVLYARDLNVGRKNSKIWYIPIISNMVGLALAVLLQLMKVADLRQMLWVAHAEMLISIATIIYMTCVEVRDRGLSPKLKQNLLFLLICVIGMAVDFGVFYSTGGMKNGSLGILCFIVYICVLGTESIKAAKVLMDFGLKAKSFEQKAYHDQLTGLYNRTAYADYTGSEMFNTERCIIAVFDLNNLKKCNDTLGHEKGDIYIKECAAIIQETFGDIGRCYRMGGDEFCAILENISLDACKRRMRRLQELVVERNRNHPEIDMGIAFGYEMFDKRIDYDINDTSRRADKMMYHEKYTMKQKKAASEGI